jgi:hypothetical protein
MYVFTAFTTLVAVGAALQSNPHIKAAEARKSHPMIPAANAKRSVEAEKTNEFQFLTNSTESEKLPSLSLSLEP